MNLEDHLRGLIHAEIEPLLRAVDALRTVVIREARSAELPAVRTCSEAAAALKLSLRTVRAYVASGRLASITVGRRRLIPVAAIEQLLRSDDHDDQGDVTRLLRGERVQRHRLGERRQTT